MHGQAGKVGARVLAPRPAWFWRLGLSRAKAAVGFTGGHPGPNQVGS